MPSVVDPHHFDADPDSVFYNEDTDPTFYPDADPDPDPSLKKANISSFYTFWLDICILMRIRIQLLNVGADPDFYLMWLRIQIWIQVTKMMRILAYTDPQHC